MGEASEIDRQLAELAEAGDGDRAFELGYHYVHEHDDLATAERYYRVAIEAGEQHSLNNLARILAVQGRNDEAEALYRRAAELGDTRAVVNYSRHLADLGREEDAILVLRAHADGDGEVAETLARTHFEREEFAEAERWFRRAAEDDRAAAITCVGVLAELRGDHEEAERWIRRGLEGGDIHAAHHLGRLLEELGREDEAVAWFERASAGGDPFGTTSLALARWRAGDLAEAERLLREAAARGSEQAQEELDQRGRGLA